MSVSHSIAQQTTGSIPSRSPVNECDLAFLLLTHTGNDVETEQKMWSHLYHIAGPMGLTPLM